MAEQRARLKEAVFLGIVAFAGCAILLVLIELGVRIVRPDVNAQDTDRTLFRAKAFGNSVGWVPNARGLSFGVEAAIDELGFRRIKHPEHFSDTWLFLGDSVTFGVGVTDDQAFPQLVQNHLPAVRVWNSAITGYSTPNYRDVVTHTIDTGQHLSRVILCYTLNDAYGNLDLTPKDSGLVDVTFGFLRRHSRLYVLFKDLAADRSKAYFMYDYAMYAEDRPEWLQAMATISDIAEALKARGIPLDVVLLPYEYQLRMDDTRLLQPQRMVKQALEAKKINVIDLYADFGSKGRSSRDFFLFGDPMHLSVLGHQVVADALVSRLAR